MLRDCIVAQTAIARSRERDCTVAQRDCMPRVQQRGTSKQTKKRGVRTTNKNGAAKTQHMGSKSYEYLFF